MTEVNIKNLKKAIAAAEDELKYLQKSQFLDDKTRFRRINRAVEQAYELLNKTKYTQKEVDNKETIDTCFVVDPKWVLDSLLETVWFSPLGSHRGQLSV